MHQVTHVTLHDVTRNNVMQSKNVSRRDLHIQTKPTRFIVITENYVLIKTAYCKNHTAAQLSDVHSIHTKPRSATEQSTMSSFGINLIIQV